MRKLVFGGLPLSALVLALAIGWLGSRHDSRLVLSVETIKPGVTCPVNSDNGAYKLDRWKVVGALDYKVDSSLSSGVSAGFQTWASAAGLSVSSTGSTSSPSVAADGTNNVFAAPLSGSTIAATYVWFDRRTRQVTEFDMVFNSNFDWADLPGSGDCVSSSSFDIQDIATHEFGHVLGIGHTSPSGANNAQTMYPYGQAGELYKRSLANGDLAAANAKY